ncbi:hypothetical protein AHF37_02380, partial [Paragonimus kellicotti]
ATLVAISTLAYNRHNRISVCKLSAAFVCEQFSYVWMTPLLGLLSSLTSHKSVTVFSSIVTTGNDTRCIQNVCTCKIFYYYSPHFNWLDTSFVI